jgi:hypothetical protein
MKVLFIAGPFEEYDLTWELSENKSMTSMDAGQDEIRQAVIDAGFSIDSKGFKATRRAASSQYKKEFEKLQEKFTRVITDYTLRFKSGEISQYRWQTWVKYQLRESYKEAFKLGLYSSGAKDINVGVAKFDEQWVKTASKHEMIYFNKLLDEIAAGRQRGSIEDRLKAYSEAMQHVFYAGRIMGTPSNHLVDWTGPNDRATCKSCRFLIEKSPYTKLTIPSTPGSGDTLCLHNCRCRLLVREVKPKVFETVNVRQRSKNWYSEKLIRIKQGKAF